MLTLEDCEFITDRWGYVDGEEAAVPDAPTARLIDMMYGEMSFVVKRAGQLGLLIELELSTPPEDDAGEVELAWGREMTEEDVRAAGDARAAAIGRQFPELQTYACQHENVFLNRVAVRVFIPDALCTAVIAATVGNAMTGQSLAAAA